MTNQSHLSRAQMGNSRISRLLLFICLCLAPTVSQAQAAFWLVQPQYDEIIPVSPKLLKVSKNGQYGLVSMKGEEVVKCSYPIISDFVEDVCLVIDSGKRIDAIISSSGAVTRLSKPYFVDTTVPSFSEGLLNVKDDKGRAGYIKINGTEFTRFEYHTALPFSYGYAVVRKGDYYFPVDKSMRISEAFMNTNYNFMSTFGVYKNKQCAVVLNKNKIYIVDIHGSILDSFGDIVVFDKLNHLIIAARASFQFDDKWRLVQVGKPSGEMLAKYDQPDNKHLAYKVNNRTYDFPKSANGLYSVALNGKELLAPQFVNASNLSESSVIASTVYGCGILYINNTVYPETEMNSRSHIVFHHYVSSPASFELTGLYGGNVSIMRGSIKCTSGKIESTKYEHGLVSLAYLPDKLTKQKGDVEFTFVPEIGGLVFPEQTVGMSYSYENAFIVTVKDQVNLTYDNIASFDVVIRNSADSKSARCSVFVNDVLVRNNVVVEAQSSIRIPYSCSVPLGDKDQMSLPVSIRIKEESCPEFSTKKTVECLRKFENN